MTKKKIKRQNKEKNGTKISWLFQEILAFLKDKIPKSNTKKFAQFIYNIYNKPMQELYYLDMGFKYPFLI